jgi:hypothetical protein
MAAILRVETGSQEGLGVALRPGDSAIVGRRGADLSIPEDTALSTQHFAVLCGADGRITLRDLGSTNGTFVNGRRLAGAMLAAGDRVDAGRTVFTVRSAEGAPRIDREDVLKALGGHGSALYGVFDAARSPHVLETLRDSLTEVACLYDGKSAEMLADAAPYLVCPAADPLLLETLVADGWGESWGVYLVCSAPLAEVRSHLRRFLMVEVRQRPVYFRFYDPRVLRSFLPTCTGKEAREFFGPIDAYVAEGEQPDHLLVLTAERTEAQPRLCSVSAEAVR